MAKKKGDRAEEARRGTKADPERIDAARLVEIRRQLELDTGPTRLNRRPSWYIEPLDKESLSNRESTTRYVYLAVEVMLFTNIVFRFIVLLAQMTEFSFAAFQELLVSDPSCTFDLVEGLFQFFGGSIVLSCHKSYLGGDVGSIPFSLVLMLVGEVVLGSIVGAICMVVLLWRSWERCTSGLSLWRSHRKFWGKVSDCAPAIIFLLVSILLALAQSAI